MLKPKNSTYCDDTDLEKNLTKTSFVVVSIKFTRVYCLILDVEKILKKTIALGQIFYPFRGNLL